MWERFSSGAEPQTATFASASGEILAIDQNVAGTSVTHWALNDADGTIRDLLEADGTKYWIDLDREGKITAEGTLFPNSAKRFRCLVYVDELQGYYDGRQWTSGRLGGLALSPTSSTSDTPYAGRNVVAALEPKQQYNFWREFGKEFVGRFDNGIQVGAGIFETGLGALLFIPSWGASSGLIANGIDNVYHGWTDTSTWTHQFGAYLGKQAGLSERGQWWVGFGTELLAGGGAGALANSAKAAKAMEQLTRGTGRFFVGAGQGLLETASHRGRALYSLGGEVGFGFEAIGNAIKKGIQNARRGVRPGEAGAFSTLDARRVVGDGLTPHHMPQAALAHTGYGAGGAIVLPHSQHILTRTYGARGAILAIEESDLPFRIVLARDIRDIRKLAGKDYNHGLLYLLEYYRKNFPGLMAK